MYRLKTLIRKVLHSHHFKYSFMVLLIVTTVCLLLTAYIFVQKEYDAKRGYEQASVDNLALSLQELLSTAGNNASMLGSLRSINSVLAMSHPQLNHYLDIANDLSSTLVYSKYESVDIFFLRSKRIYVSNMGMYDFLSYPGQDLIDLINEGDQGERWIVGREYRLYYGEQYPMPVVTYLRRLPIYQSAAAGYIAFHIPLSHLHAKISEARQPSRVITVTLNNRMLYTDDMRLSDRRPGEMLFNDGIHTNPKTAYVVFESSLNTDITCITQIPIIDLYYPAIQKAPFAASVLFGALLFDCVSAMLYSFFMLKPITKIIERASMHGGLANTDGNEYELLDKTFSQLSTMLAGMNSEMEKSLPLIREHLVLEITTNATDLRETSLEYEDAGLAFPYKNHAVVLAVLSGGAHIYNHTSKEKLKLFIVKSMTERFQMIGKCYSAYAENERLLFLLNTDIKDDLAQKIGRICNTFVTEMNKEFELPLLFSVGICHQGIPIPYHAYLQARDNLSYRNGLDGQEMVLLEDTSVYTPSIDVRTVTKAVECILDHNLPKLRTLLDRFFKSAFMFDASIEFIRRLAIVCFCTIYSRLLEINFHVNTNQAVNLIKKMDDSTSADECINTVFAFFSSLITSEHSLSEESRQHVHRAIRFIESNFTKHIAIPEIANHVSLNPVYLNKLFKLSTGKAISEYLNHYRIEVAVQRLSDTEDSIAQISEAVGYNDVRSFIRFFKKYKGITPNSFRQMNSL